MRLKFTRSDGTSTSLSSNLIFQIESFAVSALMVGFGFDT